MNTISGQSQPLSYASLQVASSPQNANNQATTARPIEKIASADEVSRRLQKSGSQEARIGSLVDTYA